MPHLYHPQLGREIDVPDDEGCVAAHLESGWKVAPEPEAPSPIHAPEPVTYEPMSPKRGKQKPADDAPASPGN